MPMRLGIHLLLALCTERANRRDDARKAYARAVELDPGNAHARGMLRKLKSP